MFDIHDDDMPEHPEWEPAVSSLGKDANAAGNVETVQELLRKPIGTSATSRANIPYGHRRK